MKAWRWTCLNLLSSALLFVGVPAAVVLWHSVWQGGGGAQLLGALLAGGAVVCGAVLQYRLLFTDLNEPEFDAGDGHVEENAPKGEHAPSHLTGFGDFAVTLLSLVYDLRSTDYRPPRWLGRFWYILAGAVVFLVLLAYWLLGTFADARMAVTFLLAGMVVFYLTFIGLFLPRRAIEQDDSLKSLLGRMGLRSVLGLRILAVFFFLGAVFIAVMLWTVSAG